jgi:diguanylate cyclase (GGDEF)-like protein
MQELMSTAYDSFRSRPLDPGGLAARVAPFVGALLLAFAFLNLKHDGGSPGLMVVAATVASMLVLAVGAIPWRRMPGWVQTLPPLAFFVLVALLIDVDGGSGSAFSPLVLLPVLWLALYGTREQLLAGILGGVAVFIVPIVWLGEPHYPPGHWQTPALWMATTALVGTVVQELVREMRVRASRTMSVVSSTDELTSLPSRAAWEERLPQELSRARREAWQLSVALFVVEGLDEVRSERGQEAADALLRGTAFAFSTKLRGTDVLVRYGDGAFASAFPGCSLGGGLQIANSLFALVEETAVSAGVACWDGAENADSLMGRVIAAVDDSRALGSEMVMSATTV